MLLICNFILIDRTRIALILVNCFYFSLLLMVSLICLKLNKMLLFNRHKISICNITDFNLYFFIVCLHIICFLNILTGQYNFFINSKSQIIYNYLTLFCCFPLLTDSMIIIFLFTKKNVIFKSLLYKILFVLVYYLFATVNWLFLLFTNNLFLFSFLHQ